MRAPCAHCRPFVRSWRHWTPPFVVAQWKCWPCFPFRSPPYVSFLIVWFEQATATEKKNHNTKEREREREPQTTAQPKRRDPKNGVPSNALRPVWNEFASISDAYCGYRPAFSSWKLERQCALKKSLKIKYRWQSGCQRIDKLIRCVLRIIL